MAEGPTDPPRMAPRHGTPHDKALHMGLENGKRMNKEEVQANEMTQNVPEASVVSQTTVEETRWERISTNLKTIGGAVLLAMLIRTVLFEAFEIEGPSMEPTLLNGDRVVVAKFMYGLFLPLRSEAEVTWGAPDLGDVVIIKSPADGVDIVKRVIGLPGDIIEIRQDTVYRNGMALPAQDLGACQYGQGANMPRCRWTQTEIGDVRFLTSAAVRMYDDMHVVVPEGQVFVLGDHRDSSNDSRNIGTIPIRRIKGKALAIYWSSGQDGFRRDRVFQAVN
jgi:signal peptidase I